jgi:Xaa-Pro dipeptidase
VRKPTYQYFSLEEYQRRLDALRARMEQKGVDVLLLNTPENIYYVSGYQTPGYYFYQGLVVPLDGEPVLIPPPHEESLVRAFSWVEEYRIYRDNRDWIETTRDVLADLGMGRKRIGVENGSWFLTSRDYLRLTSLMSDASFVDCSGLVEQGRMIKSPQEMEYIRHAARAAEGGMRAGIEAARVGATESELAVEVHRALLLAGSEYTGLPIFITSGLRSLLVHATWSPKALAANEVVFLEIGGCIHRYHAAMTRAVYLGDPPDLLLRGIETNTDALKRAKAAIKPGVPASEVFEVARERIDSANLGYRQGRRVAYSIGIAFPPGWGEGHVISLNQGESRALQPGMVFHLITTMRLSGLGAIGCSDTVLVTEDGCETLTSGVEPKLYVN